MKTEKRAKKQISLTIDFIKNKLKIKVKVM